MSPGMTETSSVPLAIEAAGLEPGQDVRRSGAGGRGPGRVAAARSAAERAVNRHSSPLGRDRSLAKIDSSRVWWCSPACWLAAGMVLMGLWQLRVYQNQGVEAAARRAAEPAVPLSAVAPAGPAVRDGYGRSVTFAGTYDPEHQLLLTVDGRHRPPSGRHPAAHRRRRRRWCVVRGIATETGSTPPTGRQEQVGVLLPSEEPRPDSGRRAIDPVRVAELAQTWPGPLVDGFVTLSAGDAERQGPGAGARSGCRRAAAGCATGRTPCSGGSSPASPW